MQKNRNRSGDSRKRFKSATLEHRNVTQHVLVEPIPGSRSVRIRAAQQEMIVDIATAYDLRCRLGALIKYYGLKEAA